MAEKFLEAKVVLLGTQGMLRIHLDNPNDKLKLKNCNIRLQVWDTAGQERFRSMAPLYYRNANAAILVFDITNRYTFDDVHVWVEEVRKNATGHLDLILIGNKSDLEEDRQVNEKEAETYANTIGAKYLSTSALTNEGISQIFTDIGFCLLETKQSKDSKNTENGNTKEPLNLNNGTYGSEEKTEKSSCCK
ncbi:DgyrCDS2224 [Dimorphilus gyrociliatus]|uniref:DgyrCDS2224 n=1 Tax=Dimorphilus gyrociliatus TaxID=2664684 RepID=A0A7I8VCN7_9ANNE|nr:DgyrCDS2224 [Dimorphilus gyrociliatus]